MGITDAIFTFMGIAGAVNAFSVISSAGMISVTMSSRDGKAGKDKQKQ